MHACSFKLPNYNLSFKLRTNGYKVESEYRISMCLIVKNYYAGNKVDYISRPVKVLCEFQVINLQLSSSMSRSFSEVRSVFSPQQGIYLHEVLELHNIDSIQSYSYTDKANSFIALLCNSVVAANY